MTASAIYQWFICKQDVPEELRRDARRSVAFHAILTALLLWMLLRYTWIKLGFILVGGFSGKLPDSVQGLIDVSDSVKSWIVLIVPALICGLRADYKYFIQLTQASGENSAKRWSCGVTVCLSLASAYCYLVLFFFEIKMLEFYATFSIYR